MLSDGKRQCNFQKCFTGFHGKCLLQPSSFSSRNLLSYLTFPYPPKPDKHVLKCTSCPLSLPTLTAQQRNPIYKPIHIILHLTRRGILSYFAAHLNPNKSLNALFNALDCKGQIVTYIQDIGQ